LALFCVDRSARQAQLVNAKSIVWDILGITSDARTNIVKTYMNKFSDNGKKIPKLKKDRLHPALRAHARSLGIRTFRAQFFAYVKEYVRKLGHNYRIQAAHSHVAALYRAIIDLDLETTFRVTKLSTTKAFADMAWRKKIRGDDPLLRHNLASTFALAYYVNIPKEKNTTNEQHIDFKAWIDLGKIHLFPHGLVYEYFCSDFTTKVSNCKYYYRRPSAGVIAKNRYFMPGGKLHEQVSLCAINLDSRFMDAYFNGPSVSIDNIIGTLNGHLSVLSRDTIRNIMKYLQLRRHQFTPTQRNAIADIVFARGISSNKDHHDLLSYIYLVVYTFGHSGDDALVYIVKKMMANDWNVDEILPMFGPSGTDPKCSYADLAMIIEHIGLRVPAFNQMIERCIFRLMDDGIFLYHPDIQFEEIGRVLPAINDRLDRSFKTVFEKAIETDSGLDTLKLIGPQLYAYLDGDVYVMGTSVFTNVRNQAEGKMHIPGSRIYDHPIWKKLGLTDVLPASCNIKLLRGLMDKIKKFLVIPVAIDASNAAIKIFQEKESLTTHLKRGRVEVELSGYEEERTKRIKLD
jgi:hypothetical protein